ncbi:MAG: DMT family transporter [Alphaproteobacteria bacterium]
MKMTLRDWVMLVGLSVIWGGAFFFAAVAVKEVPPLTTVLLRVGIAALCLWVYYGLLGKIIKMTPKLIGAFIIMGLINNAIPFSLLFWAQTSISSGLASILNATTPIFAILVGHFALADERMAVNKVLGVVLGMIGVAVLIGVDALNVQSTATWGMLACLGAALSYGCGTTFGRRFKAMGIEPGMVALGQLSGATLVLLPVVFWIDQPWTIDMPSWAAIGSILGLAVLASAYAYLLYFKILASSGSVNATLVTLLVPVSAILLGTFILGEQLATKHFIGMGIIGLGLLAVDGRLLTWARSKI